jgi:hypothetical protein
MSEPRITQARGVFERYANDLKREAERVSP